MLPQGFQQAPFAKFLARMVKGLGCAVGVEHEGVAWEELALLNRAIPFLKQSHHGGCWLEPFRSIVAPQEDCGWVTAIRVAQLARMIVVFGEENRCVVALGGILVEQLIHRSQESLRLSPGRRALAAQIRLEIRHQQSGRHSFACDIPNH